jgi:hypothetical protein
VGSFESAFPCKSKTLGDTAGSTCGSRTPVPFFLPACPSCRPSRAVMKERPIRMALQSPGCPILGQAAETVFIYVARLAKQREPIHKSRNPEVSSN